MTDQPRGARPQSATLSAISAGVDGRGLRDALREEQARLSKIAASVPGVMCELRQHADGSVTVPYASPQIKDILGFTPQELALDASVVRARIHPDDLAIALRTFEVSGQVLSPCWHECRVRHPGRGEIWVELRATPERDRDGGTRWYGFAADVTARRRAADALRGAQQRLLNALDAGGMGTWVWDLATNLVELDEVALKVWGRTREESVGLSFEDVLRWIHPDDVAGVRATARWSPDADHRYRWEIRVPLPNGQTRVVLVRGSGESDAAGRPLRVIGVCVDVTARKRSDEMHLRAQKLEALSTLAGGIAHDFNNLLFAMLGNTKLLATELPAEHPGQQGIAEIEQAAGRAADLVRGILTFSRPHELKREVSSLEKIIGDAMKLLRVSLPSRIEIQYRPAPGLPLVAADAAQLQQVLTSLVTNAVQAIGPGRGTIEVELQLFELREGLQLNELTAGRYVCLNVTDSGCGVETTTLDRIFDPFFTTKPTGQGSGLGLSVAQSVMRGHGGAIIVRSEPGHGSTFSLYFPALEAAAQLPAVRERTADPVRARYERSSGRAARASARVRSERILVVDDEPTLVSLTTRLLGRLGYKVTGYTDPVAALAVFRSAPHAFDAVVTDLSMPAMSGFDLVRGLLAVRNDIPVLMTSGCIGNDDLLQAQQKGVREVIPKPNTVEVLGEALDRVFERA
jgi:PAS domain S-box-containing protein